MNGSRNYAADHLPWRSLRLERRGREVAFAASLPGFARVYNKKETTGFVDGG